MRRRAMRARRPLYRRFQDLERRMASTRAAVAVARELVGFVWAPMRAPERLLAARAPEV